MTVAKARIARRVLLGTAALAAVWLLAVWPPPVWWASHHPRCTAMMRLRATRCPPGRPTARDRIPPLVRRLVIIGEDSRFRTHRGIDFVELAEALTERRSRRRGASTITQQLAKNLYLSPSRSPLRKLKEAVTAVRLELALSKDRILDLYLNIAEWGPGIWGVAAASEAYFGVPPSRLTETQAAALAATLPHPRTSTPTFQPARMLARRDLILAHYHGADVQIPPALEEIELDSLPVIPPIDVPIIPLMIDTLMDSVRVRVDSGQEP